MRDSLAAKPSAIDRCNTPLGLLKWFAAFAAFAALAVLAVLAVLAWLDVAEEMTASVSLPAGERLMVLPW
jgi:hypothetical protein